MGYNLIVDQESKSKAPMPGWLWRKVGLIKDLTAPIGNSPDMDRQMAFPKGSVLGIFAGRRMGAILVYTISTLFIAIFCSIVFNAMELDTEFAIAVMGSLIGGFLGSLLAVALIVDMYLPRRDGEFREQD